MAARKAFLIRISPELWDDLNRWAARELRSVNGQIEYLLRRAVDEKMKGGRSKPEPSDEGHMEGKPE
jgi:hypothetical protein